ncbi:MAG: hypothetical protein J5699_08485 [Bacteroidales bacterium]|nr:hypothetical protein [Bacteroidales bacterium]
MSRNASGHITSIAVFILYMGVLAYLCFGHPTAFFKVPRTLWGIAIDKVIHFAMFFPYPFFAQAAFFFKNRWRSLVFVIITGIIFCFTFELLQDKITTYRTSDPWDLSANITAVTIGSAIIAIVTLFRKSSR